MTPKIKHAGHVALEPAGYKALRAKFLCVGKQLLYYIRIRQLDSHSQGKAGKDGSMVPNFALSLSFQGIALLRRTGDVWAQIQEVPLDSGDLDAAVLGLRNRAEDLDPTGAQVTLIIPNEQIRYLDIADLGGDAAAQDVAARTALDGATPYAVEDLVFDHVTRNGRLYIAAVARETLDEAEGFATQNGFEPVAHAAIAPKGQFNGAVFFGTSSNWTGPKPTRLTKHIKIVAADDDALTPLSPEPTTAEVSEPAQEQSLVQSDETVEVSAESKAAPQVQAERQQELDLTAPQETSDVAPDAGVDSDLPTQAPVDDRADSSENIPAESIVEPEPEPEKMANPAPEATADPLPDSTPAMSFSTIRASRDGADRPTGPKAKPLETDDRPSAQVKPRFTPVATRETDVKNVGITQAKLDTEPENSPGIPPVTPSKPVPTKSPMPAPTPQADVAQDTSGTAPAAALARLAALRARSDKPALDEGAHDTPTPAPKVDAKAKVGEPSVAEKPKADKKRVKGRGALAGLAASRKGKAKETDASATAVTASSGTPEVVSETAGKSALGRIAALRSKPKPDEKPADPALAQAAAASLTSETERERLTVFGARSQPEIGGKPRFLGLLLTAGLLLFMAGVAAWASVFLDEGLAGLFRSEPEETAVAAAPDIAPETAAASAVPAILKTEEPEDNSDDIQLAALDTGATTDVPTPLAVPVVPQMLSPEEAAATYAATGIWQRAPVAPHALPEDGVDDIYIASIDPSIQESDAIALPDAFGFAQEPILEPQRLPPPAGQVFDMDARGLVRATPEGAISPDGVRVFAGLPPVVPPLRQALATPAPAAEAPQVNEALGKRRPRLRPDTLVESRERAVLSGISRSELAAIRPVMRPKTAQEEAVAEEPEALATDQAVNRSLTPVGRPRNMAAIVKRADSAAAAAPTEPVQTAAIAPRTVKPAAPSSRGVAQSATVRNAINLKKISLIGVYGTPAARRALVRLPNGKYKKVKVGDRLDGGRVAAIGDSELRYTKSGRNLTLKMPLS